LGGVEDLRPDDHAGFCDLLPIVEPDAVSWLFDSSQRLGNHPEDGSIFQTHHGTLLQHLVLARDSSLDQDEVVDQRFHTPQLFQLHLRGDDDVRLVHLLLGHFVLGPKPCGTAFAAFVTAAFVVGSSVALHEDSSLLFWVEQLVVVCFVAVFVRGV
jgi:hypothetical protein